ncbi:carotenoid 1,2-hydratase, partial [bacterium]|nr:carotenoid 1,2-hydratase [bacterium]
MIRSFFLLLSFVLCMERTGVADLREVAPGRQLSFPRDHGSHHDYPVEWWYFTGHLEDTEKQESYGFELTFFRVAIHPTNRPAQSPWHVQSLYLAHAALTDDTKQRFFFEKRTRRPSFGAAGAETEKLGVWLDDWRAEQSGSLSERDGTLKLSFRAVDENSHQPFS